MTYKKTRKSALLSVIRHSTRQSWEGKTEITFYSISRYERLTRASIPMQDKRLLLVSFDAEVSEVDVLLQEKILPLLRRQQDLPPSTEI